MTLQEVAQMSEVAKTIFDDLSKRSRFRDETNLVRYPSLLNLDQNETMAVFRELERLGVGSIVIGRRGKPTRFVWKYNLKDVANAAYGKIPESDMNPLFSQTGRRFKRVQTASAEIAQAPGPDHIKVTINGDEFKVSSDKHELLLQLIKAVANREN